MTDGNAITNSIKAWFVGCVSATLFFFLLGLTSTISQPSGLSFSLLAGGLFLSIIHFTIIGIFTAVPAGVFMWVAHKLRLEFLILFAGFGSALGWLGNYLFNPIVRD